MPEIRLQSPRIMSLIRQGEAAGVAQHVRMNLEAKLRSLACPLNHSCKSGRGERAPRSLVNTKGAFGSCSRCSRRSARSSSPRMGCVLGVPFLALRTARVAASKSIWSQAQVYQLACPQPVPVSHKDHGGIAVPQRLVLAASESISTSRSVRYSRVRRSAFGFRLGVTVRFLFGVTSLRCDFIELSPVPANKLFESFST